MLKQEKWQRQQRRQQRRQQQVEVEAEAEVEVDDLPLPPMQPLPPPPQQPPQPQQQRLSQEEALLANQVAAMKPLLEQCRAAGLDLVTSSAYRRIFLHYPSPVVRDEEVDIIGGLVEAGLAAEAASAVRQRVAWWQAQLQV